MNNEIENFVPVGNEVADSASSILAREAMEGINQFMRAERSLTSPVLLPSLSLESSIGEADTEATRHEDNEVSDQKGFTEAQRKLLVEHFWKAFADGDVSAEDHYGLVATLGKLHDQGGPEAIEKFIKDVNAGLAPGWKLECRPLPADKAAAYDAEAKQRGATQRTYSVQTVLTYNGKQVGQEMDLALYKR